MQGIINRPVKLIFKPVSVEISFQKSLKLQIAIFRSSTDERGKRAVKMDKTDPMKFLAPQGQISLSSCLSLLTTIPYDTQSHKYKSKEVEFQMALDIDGSKTRMNKKINLKDGAGLKGFSGKFSMQNPSVVVLYQMEVNIEGEEKEKENNKQQSRDRSQNISKEKSKGSPNSRKIKFEDQYLSADCKEESRKEEFTGRSDRGRHKTLAPEYSKETPITEDFQLSETDSRTNLKKCKSLSQSKNPFAALSSSKIETQNRPRPSQAETKYNDLIVNYRQLQKKLNERDVRIVELSLKIQELELRLQMEGKAEKSAKQLARKQQASRANYQIQINSMREEIKTYKSEIQRLTKTAITYQESSKNIANGNEQELKMLREKVRMLEKASKESAKEDEYYEHNMRDKDDIINDLKSKIYQLDKQKLQLQCKLKNIEEKFARNKQEMLQEIAELTDVADSLKQDNKIIKMESFKDLGREDKGEMKKKIEQLEKQLEKKEQLLKKMTQLRAEVENSKNNEIASLKRENGELKEAIDKLEGSNRVQEITSTTSIQHRLQVEKMKKQIEQFKKMEKNLLIQKNRLESNNHDLQDEVVKGKMAIANILNVVQETGDQKLISQAYGFTE